MASPAQVTQETLTQLLAKYREMARMRREDAAHPGQDRRPDMVRLAERFPGALREIDELSMDDIDHRAQQLADAVGGRAPVPAWVSYFVAYHGWLRAALRIKRICQGAADLSAAHARVVAEYIPELDEPALDAIDRETLAHVLRPPDGRLSAWVQGRVAAAFSTTAEEVRTALHTPGSLACP